MARRTKKDAEATRDKLLDVAQLVFAEKGVAGASLSDVAKAASLTRGAIYWHFEDKADLFNAMMQRAILPFEQALMVGESIGEQGLGSIMRVFELVLHSVMHDPSTRQVFDILSYKTECVGEMLAVRQRRVFESVQFRLQIEKALELIVEQKQISLPVSLAMAARGLASVFGGALHAWLLNAEDGCDLVEEGMFAVSTYLKGLGLDVEKKF